MRNLLSRIDLQDALIYGGLVTLSIGATMAWNPAGPLVAGALLFALGVGYFAPKGGSG